MKDTHHVILDRLLVWQWQPANTLSDIADQALDHPPTTADQAGPQAGASATADQGDAQASSQAGASATADQAGSQAGDQSEPVFRLWYCWTEVRYTVQGGPSHLPLGALLQRSRF